MVEEMVETALGAELDTRLSMYRMMQEGRMFEERARDLFLEGLVKGTSHLGIGQEAIAAGFAAALEPEDLVFCTYRGHVHTLLRGAGWRYWPPSHHWHTWRSGSRRTPGRS